MTGKSDQSRCRSSSLIVDYKEESIQGIMALKTTVLVSSTFHVHGIVR